MVSRGKETPPGPTTAPFYTSFVYALLLVGALFLFGTGCAQTRPFTIGIFDAPEEKLAELKQAGFNTVIVREKEGYLDAARSAGIEVIFIGFGARGVVSVADLRERQALDRHPALRGWYLMDEPDLHRISPAEVLALHRKVKQSLTKPTFLMLASGGSLERYRESADFLAFDWYPIPWGPIATLNRELRLARMATGDQGFYVALQAFNWSIAPHLLKTEAALRAPTFEELRCMAWLAVMNGARGVFFYTYNAPGWNLEEHPELWESVKQVVREMETLAKVCRQRVKWWPVHTDYYGAPSAMYNETWDGRIRLELFKVPEAEGKLAAGLYLLAVNTTGEVTDFSWGSPLLRGGSVSLPEGVILEGETFIKEFQPYEALMIGPFPLKPGVPNRD